MLHSVVLKLPLPVLAAGKGKQALMTEYNLICCAGIHIVRLTKKNVKSINLFTGFHLPFNLSQAELNVSLKGRLITQQEKQ